MSNTIPAVVASLDRLILNTAEEIRRALDADAYGATDRAILAALGREADNYMALREVLTGQRRPAASSQGDML